MIAIDALKPFVAAFMGYFLLGDAVPWLGYLGVVICALGVYLLNVESAEQEEADDAVEGDVPSAAEGVREPVGAADDAVDSDSRSSPRRDAAARDPDVVAVSYTHLTLPTILLV